MTNKFAANSLRILGFAAFIAALCFGISNVGAQSDQRTFPETGKTVQGIFLRYWQEHGGLEQQGYPISDQMQEKSDLNGETYTVQYFERAVFELHPENAGTQYEVLLSQLGKFQYRQKYGEAGAPDQKASTDNPQQFTQTGKTVGGKFRAYWEQHGGLAQQGYPISDEFQEKSDLNGETYTVQYFERAVLELHPENAGTPYEVLLSQLGKFQYRQKYQAPAATAVPPTTGPALPAPTGVPTAVATTTPAAVAARQPDCEDVPANQGVEISPLCGPLFTRFTLTGTGYTDDPQVGVYATQPNGAVFGAPFYVGVESDGRTQEGLTIYLDDQTADYGIWTITMEGLKTHRKVYGYFNLYPPATPTPKR